MRSSSSSTTPSIPPVGLWPTCSPANGSISRIPAFLESCTTSVRSPFLPLPRRRSHPARLVPMPRECPLLRTHRRATGTVCVRGDNEADQPRPLLLPLLRMSNPVPLRHQGSARRRSQWSLKLKPRILVEAGEARGQEVVGRARTRSSQWIPALYTPSHIPVFVLFIVYTIITTLRSEANRHRIPDTLIKGELTQHLTNAIVRCTYRKAGGSQYDHR